MIWVRIKATPILLAGLLASSPLFAAWQITRFVAYEGPAIDAPDRRKAWEASLDPSRGVSMSDQALALVSPGWREREEGAETPDPAFKDIIPNLEFFLSKVAAEYSKMGFADPVANGWIDSVVRDDDGQLAIRFYVYRSSNPYAPQAWANSGKECEDDTSRKAFVINTALFAPEKDGQRVVRGVDFATLAHELLHPVILSSPFMKGHCEVGKWLSEGIPDAISMDITRSILKTDFSESIGAPSGASKVFGLRSYSHPLQQHLQGKSAPKQERVNIDYGTSSFWRYLAEARYIERRKPNAPYPISRTNSGPGYSSVDYSWVVDLFNSRHPYLPANKMQANPLGDLRWVNEFLKSDKLFRSSTKRMFTRFVSSLANYHVDRLAKARKAANMDMPSPSMETWMNVIFTKGCHVAEDDIGSPGGANVDVLVYANAATCLRASPPPGPYPPGTMVDLLVLGNELNVLKQLRIGLPDGSIESGPDIHSFMGGGAPFYARWSFPLSAVREGTYILINMAERPERSKRFTGNFRFTLSSWESSMTTVPPPPAQPPVKESADGWRPTRREQVRKSAEASFQRPMQNMVPTPRVKRSGYDEPPRCDPQKLRLNMCGPQLRISLDINPFGVAGSFRGSAASSLYSDYMAVDNMNPAAAMQKYSASILEAERQLETRDGDHIRIAIPKIEYGFTGRFDNADIRVDRARTGERDNEQDYRATGADVPRDNGFGEISNPPVGRVTIDEYTHYVLRGSFSATLVDDQPDAAGNPVVVGDISGSFHIPSPFVGDNNFSLVTEQFEDEMIQGLLEMMPAGHLPMQEAIKQVGAPPAMVCRKLDQHQLLALGMEEACRGVVADDNVAVTMPVDCSCGCDARQQEKPLPECQAQCDTEWQQCPSGEVQLSDSMAAEIAHYRSLMEAKKLPREVQDIMIEQYSKMPEWQRELTIQGYQ